MREDAEPLSLAVFAPLQTAGCKIEKRGGPGVVCGRPVYNWGLLPPALVRGLRVGMLLRACDLTTSTYFDSARRPVTIAIVKGVELRISRALATLDLAFFPGGL